MTGQPKISVIVPVYNVEQYLQTCVESVLAQTYSNLEIILVDDGSTDGCPVLCDAYAARDARVRALHQENAGVSAARNAGVAMASGKLVAFVDSDDYAAPEMIERLYRTLAQNEAAVAVCGVRFVDEKGRTLPPRPARVCCVLDANAALKAMLYQTLFFTSPCGKLLPLELARAHPFPTGRRYEDMATTYLWLAGAEKVAVDTEPRYIYVQHAKSFMNRAFSAERFEQLAVADEVCAFVASRFPSVLPAARARRFAVCCQLLLQMPEDAPEYVDERKNLLAVMRRDAPGVMRDKNCRKKDRAAAAAFRVSGARGLRLLWRAARGGVK